MGGKCTFPIASGMVHGPGAAAGRADEARGLLLHSIPGGAATTGPRVMLWAGHVPAAPAQPGRGWEAGTPAPDLRCHLACPGNGTTPHSQAGVQPEAPPCHPGTPPQRVPFCSSTAGATDTVTLPCTPRAPRCHLPASRGPRASCTGPAPGALGGIFPATWWF